jgi:hypothetical protein
VWTRYELRVYNSSEVEASRSIDSMPSLTNPAIGKQL